MTITFINQFNPLGDRVGGIGNYIKSFIKYAPADIKFKIIGISDTLDLFEWHSINISNKIIQFLPIIKIKEENKRSKIPLSVTFSLNLFKYKKLISEQDILFPQRVEYVIFLKSLKNKIFTIIHNDLNIQLNKSRSENKWSHFPWLYNLFQSISFRRADHTFSVNHSSIDFVKSKIQNYEKKISFIPNWADPELFFDIDLKLVDEYSSKISNKYKFDHSLKKLVYLGRFQKQKNLTLLLNSFLRVQKRCVLFLAGSGDKEGFIKDFIKENMLEHKIILLGNIKHDMVPMLLKISDIYVSSSYFEGMSIALMEALMSDLFVVTTNTGESRFLISEGKNGLICEGFSIEEYSKNINLALDIVSDNNYQFFFNKNQYSPENSIYKVIHNMIKG